MMAMTGRRTMASATIAIPAAAVLAHLDHEVFKVKYCNAQSARAKNKTYGDIDSDSIHFNLNDVCKLLSLVDSSSPSNSHKNTGGD